jgi:hypothetical protein
MGLMSFGLSKFSRHIPWLIDISIVPKNAKSDLRGYIIIVRKEYEFILPRVKIYEFASSFPQSFYVYSFISHN